MAHGLHARGQGQHPRAVYAFQRLLCIDHQVEHDLAQLVGVGLHIGHAVQQLQVDLDAVAAQRVAQHVGCRAHDVAQLHGAARGRLLARHVEKGAHDAAAAFSGFADAPGVGLQFTAFGLFFQQAGAAHDDGQGVVQLVRHAGQQGAHGAEFFALAQGFALAVNLARRFVLRRQVSDEGSVEGLAVYLHLKGQQLDGKFAPAGVAAHGFPGRIAHRVTRAGQAHQVTPVAFGQDDFGQFMPQCLRAADAKQTFCRRVEVDDAAFATGRDDGRGRVVNHGRFEGVVGAFTPLQKALHLEGVGHRVHPTLPATAQLRHARLRVGGQGTQIAQHSQCGVEEPACKEPLAGHEHGQQCQPQ